MLTRRILVCYARNLLQQNALICPSTVIINGRSNTCMVLQVVSLLPLGAVASIHKVSLAMEVNVDTLIDLLHFARSNHYDPVRPQKIDENASSLCQSLFGKDYEYCLGLNTGGYLNNHYPSCLIIPIKEKRDPVALELGGSSSTFDENLFMTLIKNSKYVRHNRRVVVPTILFNGKFICRSGAAHENVVPWSTRTIQIKAAFQETDFEYQMNIDTALFIFLNLGFQEEVKSDVELLEYLGMHYLCDLRVSSKMGDYSDTAHSTEKMFKQMYKQFEAVQIPYPGVEFFEEYHLLRNPETMIYYWEAVLDVFNVSLPGIEYKTLFDKEIEDYQKWNILDFTQNYLLALLTYTTYKKGILVHCIIGVDRTPVFITLLRLSLWADGLIHHSLSPIEILYLSVAYDWYLFGHDFRTCLKKNYEIMHFCFNILNHISSSKFSLRKSEQQTAEESGSSSATAPTNREKKLNAVKELFLEAYDKMLKRPALPSPKKRHS